MNKRLLLGLALGLLVRGSAARADTFVHFNVWLDAHPDVGVAVYQNPAVLHDPHWVRAHPDVGWWLHRQPSIAYWRPAHAWHSHYSYAPPAPVHDHHAYDHHGDWNDHHQHGDDRGWDHHDHHH